MRAKGALVEEIFVAHDTQRNSQICMYLRAGPTVMQTAIKGLYNIIAFFTKTGIAPELVQPLAADVLQIQIRHEKAPMTIPGPDDHILHSEWR